MSRLPILLPAFTILATVAAYFGVGQVSWLMALAFFGTPIVVAAALFLYTLATSRLSPEKAVETKSSSKDVSARDI